MMPTEEKEARQPELPESVSEKGVCEMMPFYAKCRWYDGYTPTYLCWVRETRSLSSHHFTQRSIVIASCRCLIGLDDNKSDGRLIVLP